MAQERRQVHKIALWGWFCVPQLYHLGVIYTMATRKVEAKWMENQQRWQVKVQDDGERKAFYSSVPGRKGKIEAEKKADKWLESNHIKDVRFERLWDEFLEQMERSSKAGKKSENYIKHEQMGRLWILPVVGTMRVSKITQNHWRECVMRAYDAGKSKKTCQNIRASETAVYAYATDKRLEIERPNVKIPKDAPVQPKTILQPDEIKLLFSEDSIMHHGKAKQCFYIHAWRFIVATGLRRGELCGIETSHITGNVVHIQQAINRLGSTTPGKNSNANRSFVLSRHAETILEDQRAMLRSMGIISPWVFPAPDGGPADPNAVYRTWKTYRQQHGIKSNLHELRHTLISIAKADVPEELLKRVVGHSKSMDTFGVYGHDVQGELDRAAAILDTVFDRVFE